VGVAERGGADDEGTGLNVYALAAGSDGLYVGEQSPDSRWDGDRICHGLPSFSVNAEALRADNQNLGHGRHGRFELSGGTHGDLVDAREWVSLFMPEVTVGVHLDTVLVWLPLLPS
jgi:hypothetical protein